MVIRTDLTLRAPPTSGRVAACPPLAGFTERFYTTFPRRSDDLEPLLGVPEFGDAALLIGIVVRSRVCTFCFANVCIVLTRPIWTPDRDIGLGAVGEKVRARPALTALLRRIRGIGLG